MRVHLKNWNKDLWKSRKRWNKFIWHKTPHDYLTVHTSAIMVRKNKQNFLKHKKKYKSYKKIYIDKSKSIGKKVGFAAEEALCLKKHWTRFIEDK